MQPQGHGCSLKVTGAASRSRVQPQGHGCSLKVTGAAPGSRVPTQGHGCNPGQGFGSSLGVWGAAPRSGSGVQLRTRALALASGVQPQVRVRCPGQSEAHLMGQGPRPGVSQSAVPGSVTTLRVAGVIHASRRRKTDGRCAVTRWETLRRATLGSRSLVIDS